MLAHCVCSSHFNHSRMSPQDSGPASVEQVEQRLTDVPPTTTELGNNVTVSVVTRCQNDRPINAIPSANAAGMENKQSQLSTRGDPVENSLGLVIPLHWATADSVM